MIDPSILKLFELTAQQIATTRQKLGEALGEMSAAESALVLLRDLVYAPVVLEGNGTVTTYAQRNPLWGAAKLGTSDSTIGGYGCLITCVASMLTDAGSVFNPLQLNTWLNANGGFTGGNLFVFKSVDKLNVVKFYDLADCSNKPAPVGQFDELVEQGDFVIVKVDFDPATASVQEHWVRYLGCGRMFDPWHGDIAPIVPRYRGKNAAQAILRAALYKKVTG